MVGGRGAEGGPKYNPLPRGLDLVGGSLHERGARGRLVAPGRGAGEGLVVARLTPGGDIRMGDPGLDPGARTMNPKFTRGLHGISELSSAAILTTDEGVEDVGGHFLNVVNTQRGVKYLTTPTWSTSRGTVDRVLGDHRLPQDREVTAESLTRLGVQIVNGVLKETRSDATMLLSVRPTGDSVTLEGTLPRDKSKKRYSEHLPWLIEEAKKGSRKFVVLLETAATLDDAASFAEVAQDLKVPYAVTVRPGDDGGMADGNSYGKVAEAIDSDLLAFAGGNCNTIGSLGRAMRLASHQSGAEIFTLYAAPNGVEGLTESYGGLTSEEMSQVRTDNIRGVKRLRDEFGTVVFAGCCGSTADNLESWRKELEGGSALSGRVSARSAGSARYLVYSGQPTI